MSPQPHPQGIASLRACFCTHPPAWPAAPPYHPAPELPSPSHSSSPRRTIKTAAFHQDPSLSDAHSVRHRDAHSQHHHALHFQTSAVMGPVPTPPREQWKLAQGGSGPLAQGTRRSKTVCTEKEFVIFGPSPAKGTLKMILACELYGLNMSFVIKSWSLLQLGDFVVLEILSPSETAIAYTGTLCPIDLNLFVVPVSVWDDASSFPYN